MPERGVAREPQVHERAAAGDRARRLHVVLRASGLQPVRPPSGVESYSNDTYLIEDPIHGALVLRICYRGDVDRLPREAAIGRHVPPGVGYPDVLGSGETSTGNQRLTWSLTRQLRGSTLMDAWHRLSDDERRRAARSTARALRALHAWRPPDALVTSLRWPSPPALTTPELVIGASIHPLPIERAGQLIDELRTRVGVEGAMVDAVERAIEQLSHLAPVLDDPSIGGLIHGDLQLSNIWLSDRGEAGLIDLEWARFAPAWMDVARLRDNADTDVAMGFNAHGAFIGRLEEEYPELFAIDRFDDRIRLLCLVFQVRQALISPPVPGIPLAVDHPIRMLERLV